MSRAKRAAHDPRELDTIANATGFVASAFRGRGLYEKREAPTLEAARIAAREIMSDRHVMIYAIFGERQALVEIVRRSPA